MIFLYQNTKLTKIVCTFIHPILCNNNKKDAPRDIRLMRRIQRDTVERKRTLPDILAQYSSTVRPMHNEFVEPSKHNADLIVHGHDEDEVVSRKRMELAMRVIAAYVLSLP